MGELYNFVNVLFFPLGLASLILIIIIIITDQLIFQIGKKLRRAGGTIMGQNTALRHS